LAPADDDAAHLWDMLDAARAVQVFMAGVTFERYTGDRMLRGAVERNLEIVGEAAGRVSPAFRSAHPQIPWSQIVAQRNVLIHRYGAIDHRVVWRVATERIPQLIADLEPLIPSAPDATRSEP
jgi:uncharacterized protein with HEPN domain